MTPWSGCAANPVTRGGALADSALAGALRAGLDDATTQLAAGFLEGLPLLHAAGDAPLHLLVELGGGNGVGQGSMAVALLILPPEPRQPCADLAAAVAAWSFPGLVCEDVDLRVIRSGRPDRTEPGSVPADERAFAARVRRVAGDLQLLKAEPRGEVAPLVPRTDPQP